MSLHFNHKILKNKSTIANIKSNQNILLSKIINFITTPSSDLSSQRSKSKNNYSTKNIYEDSNKKAKTNRDKDKIIKKLKEKIKSLENKIKFLEIKIKNLTKVNSNNNTLRRNSKNHSIIGKEILNEKKEYKSIIMQKKKTSLKSGYYKKRTCSELITEDNLFGSKDKSNNTIINNNTSFRKNSKNRKKIELNMDKFERKKQIINFRNINDILKKSIIKKTHLRKNTKRLSNLNDLDLKTSTSKLISKIPKTSRCYQTESNVNLSSKITNSTTFNCHNKNNSHNYSDYNNVLTSNNNIYTEEEDTKNEHFFLNHLNNYHNNDILKSKLNAIKKRTENLLEIFALIKLGDS